MLNYNNIKSIAEKNGYSLETLAPKINLSGVGFRKALTNETLTLKHAVNLTKILHCSLHDLMTPKNYESNDTIITVGEPSGSTESIILSEILTAKESINRLEKLYRQSKKAKPQKLLKQNNS